MITCVVEIDSALYNVTVQCCHFRSTFRLVRSPFKSPLEDRVGKQYIVVVWYLKWLGKMAVVIKKVHFTPLLCWNNGTHLGCAVNQEIVTVVAMMTILKLWHSLKSIILLLCVLVGNVKSCVRFVCNKTTAKPSHTTVTFVWLLTCIKYMRIHTSALYNVETMLITELPRYSW